MSAADFPSASLIINTLNRADHLENALLALEQLDYPAFEIVVVNGPSTDTTAEILERWSDRIKVLSCPEPNLAISRNIGIAAAAGDIICFVDDDAAPHPKWLRHVANGFRDPEVGGVGGFTVDNTGVRWQVRKTVCDRFGNAFNVSAFFDERTLNQPGSAYYPSLLGTNCAYRATALRGIGGFDHAFAYLLDETDVCLRLVDAGWKVIYEPKALVYHQFAASHVRSSNRIARTFYPSAFSRGYFTYRHGTKFSPGEAGAELEKHRETLLESTKWQQEHGQIDRVHRHSLDEDLVVGLEDGARFARSRDGQPGGDLDSVGVEAQAFKAAHRAGGMRIAFVSQGWPPETEAGIARWTAMAATGLAARGHQVHVITRAVGDESVTFKDGLWIHRVSSDAVNGDAVAEAYDLPPGIAAWCERVRREIDFLKSFGLQVVSFPIWDLEGLPLVDDPDLPAVVSLHTTYKMAKPFKPEWSARPLFEYAHVDRLIKAELALLARAPVLLANSQAVLTEIDSLYGVNPGGRSTIVAHGVENLSAELSRRAEERDRAVDGGAPIRALFVGRFEQRKGYDIAARAALRLLEASPTAEVWFAGEQVNADLKCRLASHGLERLFDHPRARFMGLIARDALDRAYADCDLLLAPSRFESFGLIAAEAFAAGRPVFALAIGGLAEVIEDKVTGKLFVESERTADEIAGAALALDRDRQHLRRMGSAARAAFEARFTVERMVVGLEAVYRKAAETKTRVSA